MNILTKILGVVVIVITLFLGYAVYKNMKLEQEITTNTHTISNLRINEKVLRESLIQVTESFKSENDALRLSLDSYVSVNAENAKTVELLKSKIMEIEDETTKKCFTEVYVPNRVLDVLYNKD